MKTKLLLEKQKKAVLRCWTTLFFLIFSINALAQTTRYVNGSSGTDSGDCTNPETPCQTIFFAYDVSESGDTVEVSEGIYTEFFAIEKSISIHGAGQDLTIIQAHENPELSASRVFYILPGFEVSFSNLTIRHGRSLYGGGIYNYLSNLHLSHVTLEDNFAYSTGGGMQNFDATVTLENVIFRNNHVVSLFGAGMHNTNSTIILNEVIFIGNVSEMTGGGMYNVNTSGVFTNVSFIGNAAGNSGGGMVNFDNSSPTLTNVLFSGNSSGTGGGAMSNVLQSSPVLTNVTFSGNKSGDLGGAILNLDNSSPTLINVIIWENSYEENTSVPESSIANMENSMPTISHSLIANSGGSANWDESFGIDEGNNIDEDPIFVEQPNPANAPSTEGNLRLQGGSPAIDSGNTPIDLTLFPGGPDNPLDLDSNPRVYNNIIDMGAYEFQNVMALNNFLNDSLEIILYPNPTTGIINLQTKEKINSVSVYNSVGQKVSFNTLNKENTSIDISNLSSGIYFVEIVSGDKTVKRHKVIKK